ncbi:hypothetical protein BH09ACT4_BH09ACT4_16740 [soil metagenome]
MPLVVVLVVLGWVAVFVGFVAAYIVAGDHISTTPNPILPWVGWSVLAMVGLTIAALLWLVRWTRRSSDRR